MADLHGLYLRQDSGVLATQDFGNRASPTKAQTNQFLKSLAASEETFKEGVDHERLPKNAPSSDYTGTINNSMSVYVSSAVDISQP